MVKLKEIYNKNGFIHNLIWRDEEYAITRLIDEDTKKFVCFEAFKIKIRESGPGNSTAEYPRESTPSNEAWGKYGFSVYTEDEAKNKIELMKKRFGKNKNKN